MPDIVTSKIFVDGEKGITATKMNQIISGATIQPSFVTSKPASSTLDPTDQLLEVKGAGTYATITGSQLVSSVSSQVDVTPQITAVRLRSFSAVGNGSFEVDQRNVFNGVTVAGGASYYNWILDRWLFNKATASAGALGITVPQAITGIPGTNYVITTRNLRFTVNTAQASMAAGDLFMLTTQIEGPSWRELMGDVHSVSILCRSSVANLKFGLALRDSPTTTKSLVKMCSLGAANTWTIIQLPAIVVWPSGNFNYAPGSLGYEMDICLAAGSNFVAPATDTWQSGTFLSASGQSNFLATAGATLDLACVQHEPGQPTTLIDKPFTQNYDECLRYYQKSYPYPTAVATIGANSYATFYCPTGVSAAAFSLQGSARFHKPMAKAPTVIPYNHSTGAANNAFMWYATSGAVPNATSNQSISSVTSSMSGISALNVASGTSTAPLTALAEWTADTGW